MSTQDLIADLREYLYRVSSQVPFEHAQWANERGAALLDALKKMVQPAVPDMAEVSVAPQPVGEVPMPEPDGSAESDIKPLPGGGYQHGFVDAWSEPLMRTYGDARYQQGYAAGVAAGGEDAERYRAALLSCARKAEALKQDCSTDPESAQAIRNAQYQAISTTAHIAIGTISGPEESSAAIDAALRGEVKP